MPSYSRNEVILVQYPFSDLSGSKVRPAVIVSAPHPSHDLFIVPLTSKTAALLPGEFELSDWASAGLNVPTALKRGVYTLHEGLVAKLVGRLTDADARNLESSLRGWLAL